MSLLTYTNEVRSVLGDQLQHLESASLRLQKMVILEKKNESREFEAVAGIAKKNSGMFTPRDYSFIPGSSTFSMKLMGRMMVNQAEGLFENAGMKLHRFFGYPVIPGSTLKGVARHAAWWEWSETKDVNTAKEIAELFGFPTNEKKLDDVLKGLGYTDSKGAVSFLDAIPVDGNWSIVVDMLNPHHGCDTKNPVPVTFPAIDKGAKFSFSVVAEDEVLRSKAVKWLKLALNEDGVGSKTAAGYGWFKKVK